MKNAWTIGKKVLAGFSAVIVIAVLIGAIAIYNMNAVNTIAGLMAQQSVPAANVANSIERSALATRLSAAYYAFINEESRLNTYRTNIAKVQENLAEASRLAEAENIDWLRTNAREATAAANEYDQASKVLVQAIEAMHKEEEASLVNAKAFMDACEAYIAAKEKQIDELAKDPEARASEVISLNSQITIVNNIIDEGNAIIIGTWYAIANRSPEHFLQTQKRFSEIDQHLNSLRALTDEASDLELIKQNAEAGKAYSDNMDRFLIAWNQREEVFSQWGELGTIVTNAAQQTAEYAMNETTAGADSAAAALTQATLIVVVGLSIGAIVGILLALFITRGINNTLHRISESLGAGAEQTASAAGQVSQSSQSMAEGASEQASSLEETSASLEEMTSMTKQNAENANQASKLMALAKETVDDMARATDEMSKAISEIKSSSDETAKIIKTIDEIAFQTNLLALNAAVEAARAGDAGKGFAVVAEEVRNLAQRSAEAARNTAEMIAGSVKNADNGVQVTDRVSEALKQTVTNSEKVAQLVAEIAAASNEQAQGIEQINTAVAQMDQVTQSNAANSEESASASEELSAQAEEMQRMVMELVAMVGGAGSNGASNGSRTSAAAPARRPAQSRALTVKRDTPKKRTAAPAHATAQQSVVKPEQIIPLGDDDLDDF
jgi:methyl-accepting chemotaxis protein